MEQKRDVGRAIYHLLADLRSCSLRKDLDMGRSVHSKAMESKNDSNMHVTTALIKTYAKCGRMIEARYMFDCILKPDVIAWNVLLMGYARNGHGLPALEIFFKMKELGCLTDSVTYVAALKACSSLLINGATLKDCLNLGRRIHSEAGIHLKDQYVQSTLIDMYSKCGSMVEACCVFKSIQDPDVVCWTALLMGYVENGNGLAALKLFSRMKARGCAPNSVTYVAALKACTLLAQNGDDSMKADLLERGRQIHAEIDCQSSLSVQSILIDMYSKCISMVDARNTFDSIGKPDVVCWNVLLLGYAENGDGLATLELFSKMKTSTCVPDSITYVACIKACTLIGSLALGRKFHMEITEFNTYIVTSLVDFYAKCGSIVEAREVFDRHRQARDIYTWNALLGGYHDFDSDSVFELFDAMQDEGFLPDSVTLLCLLLCCTHAGLVERARQYLEEMPLRYGVAPNVAHYNCMVDVLGRANQLNEAILVLRKMPCSPNAVTWTTLLSSCCKWKNAEIGELAFQSLLDLNKDEASTHVLMAHICRGVQEKQEMRENFELRLCCR